MYKRVYIFISSFILALFERSPQPPTAQPLLTTAACDPFLVLLDGAGLAPTDSVAVLPAGRLPSAATAGTPVGGALSRALRPGVCPALRWGWGGAGV